MKLSTPLMYDGNPRSAADAVTKLEKAGLDTVWVAEAYGFDSPTLMGYLAARTETVEIGSAILNIYSRTPMLLAQTAAGLDNVSGGRAILGLGVTGYLSAKGSHEAEEIHEALASVAIGLIAIHVAGVLLHVAATRENLVAGMIHGRELGAERAAIVDRPSCASSRIRS